ncbi:bacteriocin [Rhodospirillum rubrum]|uniref:family 1 encapsulin nanocompartment shell protein n=1 Tax=Rhodospirillum rubrum TaxID=1085 RepID=UPI0019030D4D|nr:family 1 encapsulin nanocompartment shell protein [Rhodospirillum rubrum]MBK1663951.1 bacteriocin [Rhodospirillum rubrum]MBK1676599.1 bacteriocin [Rhodospirillum rubrum]
MNDLMRDLAPISAKAWAEIETEARGTLTVTLAARKVVDFKGPLGWDASSVSLGRTEALAEEPKAAGAAVVTVRKRAVQPLIELCVPFTLKRAELEAIARGAADADLDPVIEAARAIAIAEDRAVFHGFAAGAITGIGEASAEHALDLPADLADFPGVLVRALAVLRDRGVDGPYALVLGRTVYQQLMETTTPGGYPVLQHVRRLFEGPLIWAPGVDGAMLISQRGGDFELTVGRDFSIGYHDHDAQSVHLYLQESMTFRCLGPEAAVPLRGLSQAATKA